MKKKNIVGLILGFCLCNFLFYPNLFSQITLKEKGNNIVNNDTNPFLSSLSDSIVPDWNFTWGGSSGEGCSVLTNDSQGNIFALGNTQSYGAGGSDICIIKLNKSGNLEWNITWGNPDSDLGNDIIINNNSDIYVVGYNYTSTMDTAQLCLIKFNASGNQEWNVTYGGMDFDRGNGISIDSSENIYIVGTTKSFGASDNNIWLLKYNKTGHLQWNTTMDFGNNDRGRDIFIDSDSYIYLTGSARNQTTSKDDIFLMKLDLGGNRLWNKTWGGTFQTYDPSFDRDSSNNIYISGVKSGDSMDLLLLKYGSSGNLLWNTTWGGDGEEWIYDVLVDRNDHVWITGSTFSFGVSSKEAFIIKFDYAGNILWNTTWGYDANDIGRALNMDVSNNILMGGNTQNASTFDYNLFIVKFVDNLAPIINIVSPSENDLHGSTPPLMNINIEEPNLDQIWYQLDNGTLTTGNYPWTGVIDPIAWNLFGNGTVSISVYASDTNNNIGFAVVSVRKDIITPKITIYGPIEMTSYKNAPSYNITIEEANLENFWYTLNDGNNIAITSLTGVIESDVWAELSKGNVTISFYAEDKAGNIESESVTVLKTVKSRVIPFGNIFVIIGIISCASIIQIILRRKNFSASKD
ncbi:MAG: SBBP repeat-containing protein [Candidatus Lokiarchaeia archaeon]